MSNLHEKPYITIIKDAGLGKAIFLEDGHLKKSSLPYRASYNATVIKADIQDLHDLLEQNKDIAIICGYPEVDGKPYQGDIVLLSEKEFKTSFPFKEQPYIFSEEHEDGSEVYYCTRTKDIFRQSAFILLDIDIDEDAPDNMQGLTISDLMNILVDIDPCFTNILHLVVPSSSSNITDAQGNLLSGSDKKHIYLQVTEPTDIKRFIESLVVKLTCKGFFYEKASSDGKRLFRTLFDLQAISQERLCYESKPTLHDGLKSIRAKPELRGSHILDTKLLLSPSAEEIDRFGILTGKSGGQSHGSLSGACRLSDLKWDTVITLSNGNQLTPREFKDKSLVKESCHSPFREDRNPSAFISLDNHGNPFIYDAATNESHFIEETALQAPEADRYEVYTPDDAIQFMNSKYAIAVMGSKLMILEPDAVDYQFNYHEVKYYNRSEFDTLLKFKKVNLGTKQENIVQFWISHKDARRYYQIIFDPNCKNQPDTVFNLFRGFDIEPIKGSWLSFKRHIFHVIAQRDKRIYKYILDWMANIVQSGERPGVALVLLGGRGVGKGVFGNLFGSLFGPHFISISQSSQLVGNFNAHLATKILVLADEACYVGDKKAENTLKSLITEDTTTLEKKGVDVVKIKNNINIIFATNEDWAIPAGEDERRYLVLRVSDERKQDHNYFKNVDDEMRKHGGLAAMLHDLLRRKVNVNVLRKVPKTAALMSQKIENNPLLSYLIDCINNESLASVSDGKKGHIPIPWAKGTVLKDDFFYSYCQFLKGLGKHQAPSKESLGKSLKRLLPDIVTDSKTKIDPKTGDSLDKQVQCYKFPPIETCKRELERMGSIEWSKPEYELPEGINPDWFDEIPVPLDHQGEEPIVIGDYVDDTESEAHWEELHADFLREMYSND